MRCALYVRVSSPQQVERESLTTQEERLKLFCKALGHSVVKVYREEGMSAKDLERTKLAELMEDIRTGKGKIEAVAVIRVDRITRSLRDSIKLLEFFETHDIKLISISQNIDTSGSMGRLVLNMLVSVAQAEREGLAERVSDDMHHRASNGKWNGGVVPLGYVTRGKLIKELVKKGLKEDEALKEAGKLTPEKGRLYVVPEQADLVRRIYDSYLELKSLRRVTHELNKQGIKTPERTTWAAASIRRILISPVYIGKLTYGKRKSDLATGRLKKVKQELWKIVKAQHESIVSEQTFNRVQDLLKERYVKPTKAKKIHLLGGLLRCAKCNGGLFGYTFSKDNGKQYRYYRCQNSIQKGKAICKGMVVPAELVEKQVIDTLLNLSRNEKFLGDKERLINALKEQAKPSNPHTEDEKKRLVQEEKRLEEKREVLLEKLESRVIDDATFIERFDKIKEQLQAVRDRIAELAAKGEEINFREIALQSSYEELCDLPKIWELLEDEEKREKLRTTINQVIVNYDKERGRLDLKMQLFVDNASSSKARTSKKFHFVVFPLRTDKGSSRPRA